VELAIKIKAVSEGPPMGLTWHMIISAAAVVGFTACYSPSRALWILGIAWFWRASPFFYTFLGQLGVLRLEQAKDADDNDVRLRLGVDGAMGAPTLASCNSDVVSPTSRSVFATYQDFPMSLIQQVRTRSSTAILRCKRYYLKAFYGASSSSSIA
jgi:hypothetical protein